MTSVLFWVEEKLLIFSLLSLSLLWMGEIMSKLFVRTSVPYLYNFLLGTFLSMHESRKNCVMNSHVLISFNFDKHSVVLASCIPSPIHRLGKNFFNKCEFVPSDQQFHFQELISETYTHMKKMTSAQNYLLQNCLE